jgi:hypothetical protein
MHRHLTAEEIPEWELQQMIREVMLLVESFRCRTERADLKEIGPVLAGPEYGVILCA